MNSLVSLKYCSESRTRWNKRIKDDVIRITKRQKIILYKKLNVAWAEGQKLCSTWGGDCWWAVWPWEPDWLQMAEVWLLPQDAPLEAESRAGLDSVRVCRFGWVTSVCTCLQTHMHTNIHTGHQLHLSLTWESLMTEAEKPKKRPPRSPPPPSFFFPPSLSLFTARSDINAPYVRTFSNSVWHAINKRTRHTHTSTPSVHCVIWHGGWNEHSEFNIYSTARTRGNEISSVWSRADVDLHL